ncbi:tetratricopeptide repeat protein [Aeromonas caviae]|uniref:tetratricopeptide repeat protein n=1 Tax=Aeromonas caviae TaxID=648 RepID=UPI00403F88B3
MSKLPAGWDDEVHSHWSRGDRQQAVQQVLMRLNEARIKPVPLQLQLAYYLFLSGDPASAAQVLMLAHQGSPEDDEVLRNLCVCLSRSGQHERAVVHLTELVRREPADYLTYDGLCTSLDNVLAAAYLYPGWRVRFYVDASVPGELLTCLREHGAEVRMQPDGQSLRQRLCWRFQVANDPGVGRFLVRDADSVLNLRERLAVDDWLASGRWFHIMRDWWSHTDLVLAGMWGGVAGVLPPLQPLLEGYQSRTMETPNIDQWFLRDCLWRYLRQSALIHDRCFAPAGVVPWPQPAPAGNEHVGQDLFRAQGEKQAARLAPWIARVSCLR